MELAGLTEEEILYSYVIIQAEFEVPDSKKYPSL